MTAESAAHMADPAALVAALVELESRPMSLFRTLQRAAFDAERRAVELGERELAQRAALLQVSVLLREGRSEDGGRAAHQVLAWAQHHDSRYLAARAHRELAIFYRQVGDAASALTHAVECVANIPDDAPDVVRARHLLCLAVALDETGSAAEADRRFHECLDIAVALEDHELTLYILNNMTYTAYENGDVATAQALIGRMRSVRDRGGRTFSANELDTIARVELMGGHFAEVESTLHDVLDDDQLTTLGDEGDAVAECRLTLAEARLADGRFAEAQEALDAALRLADARGLSAIRARVYEEQAALFAATGRFREAYDQHRIFHAEATTLQSTQRDVRARALQAVFEATEARRASEHFREMAHRDALTGLYNRRYINERLPSVVNQAAVRRSPISVALLDLDHFKRVNDTLSHGAGDQVLQRVAELLLMEAATGTAVAARWGGEEFLLAFLDADTTEAVRRCERLRLRIREYNWKLIVGDLPVTASFGVTTSSDGNETLPTLLSRADTNLYEAKHQGRDRVVATAYVLGTT